MKQRTMKLQQIVATGKLGAVEGVIVTPHIAKRILDTFKTVDMGILSMRDLCKKAVA